MGHAVYEFSLDSAERQEWHRIHGVTDITWTEAGADPVEHFAETYAHYILQRAIVRRRFVEEYVFLKKSVFAGGTKTGNIMEEK